VVERERRRAEKSCISQHKSFISFAGTHIEWGCETGWAWFFLGEEMFVGRIFKHHFSFF
jgi:hypothetical protein